MDNLVNNICIIANAVEAFDAIVLEAFPRAERKTFRRSEDGRKKAVDQYFRWLGHGDVREILLHKTNPLGITITRQLSDDDKPVEGIDDSTIYFLDRTEDCEKHKEQFGMKLIMEAGITDVQSFFEDHQIAIHGGGIGLFYSRK